MLTFLLQASVLSVILWPTEAMDIVRSAPLNTTMIREGDSMALSCEADVPWFLCVWTSPKGEKQCAIQDENKTTSVCQGDPRVHLEGSSTMCTISVSDIQRADRGTWMCLLQDGEQFQPAQKLLQVEVATRGQVEMVVRDKQVSEGVVRLTEGDEVELECKVDNAFPAPEFLWAGLELERRVGREVKREEEVDNLKVQEEVAFNEDSGTFSSRSKFPYTARLEDANSSVVCTVQLSDRQGNLLYRQQTNLTLEVVPPPPPVTTASSTSISGLILGSSIGALLVLLLLILIAVYICRSKQKKREPTPPPPSQPAVWSTSTQQEDHIARESHLNSTFDSSSLPEYADVVSSGSSSSSATVPSLSRLPTLPCLQETHFPSSSLGHPPPGVLSSRSLGCPSRLSFGDEDNLTIPSRAASTLGVSLSPAHLFSSSTSPTPPCPGSRASNRGSLFHCSHDCFSEDEEAGDAHQQHQHRPLPASRPLSPTFL